MKFQSFMLYDTQIFVCMCACVYICLYACVCVFTHMFKILYLIVHFMNCIFHLINDLHLFKLINTNLHHRFQLVQIILFFKSMTNQWTITSLIFLFYKKHCSDLPCTFSNFYPWCLFAYDLVIFASKSLFQKLPMGILRGMCC